MNNQFSSSLAEALVVSKQPSQSAAVDELGFRQAQQHIAGIATAAQQLADLLSRVKTGETVRLNLMRLRRSGPWIQIHRRAVQLALGARARTKAKEEI